MVDIAIIELVKERNNEAFKLLYEHSIHYVYSIVRRYVTIESQHADVIQEIFARVFLSIETFDPGKGVFKFWLRRIVINQCIQHFRKTNNQVKTIPIDSINEPELEIEPLLDQLSRKEIEAYLLKMPEGYRRIFMLIVLDEYSHKEVGELLNISAETSRSQLFRAKEWLRRNIFIQQYKSIENGR